MVGSTSVRLEDQAESAPLRAVSKHQSQIGIVWGQLRRNRTAMIGATILAIEILLAIAAPVIVPFDPYQQNPPGSAPGPLRRALVWNR